MIRKANSGDFQEIIALWTEAFLDNEDDILSYLNIHVDDVFVYVQDNRVCAMLSLLPVTLENKKGRYVYAVATLKAYRSRGISTKLIDFAKEHIKSINEEFLVLVPANEGLFDFYKKRNFTTLSCIEHSEYKKTSDTLNNLSINKISPSKYKTLRKLYTDCDYLIEWNELLLEEICNMYNGGFYEIKEIGAAFFGFRQNDEFIIKELCCSKESTKAAINAAFDKFNIEKIKVTTKGTSPFAMIYPDFKKDIYFNIALD